MKKAIIIIILFLAAFCSNENRNNIDEEINVAKTICYGLLMTTTESNQEFHSLESISFSTKDGVIVVSIILNEERYEITVYNENGDYIQSIVLGRIENFTYPPHNLRAIDTQQRNYLDIVVRIGTPYHSLNRTFHQNSITGEFREFITSIRLPLHTQIEKHLMQT